MGDWEIHATLKEIFEAKMAPIKLISWVFWNPQRKSKKLLEMSEISCKSNKNLSLLML